jgi:hypothetical protein
MQAACRQLSTYWRYSRCGSGPFKGRGADVLFEQHGSRKRTTDFGKGMALGKKDHLIDIPKSKIKPGWMTQQAYEDTLNNITIREFKVE